jgi:undecaprenyl-diphosphatase
MDAEPPAQERELGPAWLEDAERIDAALYAAVARTPSPSLDLGMARLSNAANFSGIWIASAAALATWGGERGRHAAKLGLASIAVASAVVNIGMKPLGRRRRPARAAANVPVARHVKMPTSTSFPSGHSASAFAFVTGVGHVHPQAAVVLRGLAGLVAYSRIHTGVHYPGDVVAGGLTGTALGQLASHFLADRLA